VHQTFGTPVASGLLDGGERFDDFRSHRKLARHWRGGPLCMVSIASGGLAEVLLFPNELRVAATQVIVGQNIRFVYHADGTVKEVFIDGEREPWVGQDESAGMSVSAPHEMCGHGPSNDVAEIPEDQ
jgi:hypothetical protein